MRDNFAAESFHIRKLCSRLSLRKAQFFYTENEKNFTFKAPSGLGAMYIVHLRLIGKLVVDFLLVIIEFSSCFRFVTIHAFDGQTGQTEGRMAFSWLVCVAFNAAHKNEGHIV